MGEVLSALGYTLVPGVSGKRAHQVPRLVSEARRAFVFNALAGVACLLFGVLTLMLFEGWPSFKAVYVLAQIATTIGYGDFAAKTQASMLFMSAYAIGIILAMAYLFKLVLGRFMENQERVLCTHLEALHFLDEPKRGSDDGPVSSAVRDIMSDRRYGALSKVLLHGMIFSVFLWCGTFLFRNNEHCSCSRIQSPQKRSQCEKNSLEACAYSEGAAVVMDLSESFYMAITTLATMGFGDYQPRSNIARGLAIVWMSCGAFATATLVTSIANYFFEGDRCTAVIGREFMNQMHEKEFMKVDMEGKGHLTQADFLIYALCKYDLLEQELLEEMNQEFDRIDRFGRGYVTLDMLRSRNHELREMFGALGGSHFVQPAKSTLQTKTMSMGKSSSMGAAKNWKKAKDAVSRLKQKR